MSSTPDPQAPAQPSEDPQPPKKGSGVWRFALEGADDGWEGRQGAAAWLGRGQEAPVGQVLLWLDADGVLVATPSGDLGFFGLAQAEAGHHASKLFGSDFADALVERARACIQLHVELHGSIEVSSGTEPRRYAVSLAPGHSSECPRCCVATVRGFRSAASTRLADGWNWQTTVALAAGVAHRFNNLLVAITGNAGLVRASLPAEHPEQAALQDMEQAARDMAAMTRSLLAFAGEGRYATRQVSLNELASRALAALEPSRFGNVAFVQSYEPALPAIQADPHQLEQAIYNLLRNAVEAVSATGGQVEVRTGMLEAESLVSFKVLDSGPGMDEAVQARIFEPFFTTKAPGRGMGLPVVLGIARGHQGSVRVRTSPQGTEVELQLPYGQTHGRAAGSKAHKAGAASRTWVLVVDDDKGTVRVLERALQGQGYAVLAASTGEEALRLAAARKAELALCIVDMALPDTSGDVLCAQLKQLLAGVPVLVCSGYAGGGVEQQAAGAGADGFMAKPFSHGELLAAVAKVVAARG
jgi:signal transduction histidine kinase/CheY-like chemotaxis protein